MSDSTDFRRDARPGLAPKYRRHSTRDKAFVEYRGKRFYLPGRFDSNESILAYKEFCRALADGKIPLPPRSKEPEFAGPPLVCEVVAAYLRFAYEYYPDGRSSEYGNLRNATAFLVTAYGEIDAEAITPKLLRSLRDQIATPNRTRSYVNAIVARIKRMYRWAVDEELVPASVWHALMAVPAIRKGRSQAKESIHRGPVKWECVEPVLAEVSPTVRAMILLQWSTGARGDSICRATPEQFNRNAGKSWEWRPRHKTEHLADDELVLYVGPKGQSAAAPFFEGRGPSEFLFSPQARNRRNPRYRRAYDATSYRNAIIRAVRRVNAARATANADLPEAQRWLYLPEWTPHQLRHARGQEARDREGLEAAQAVLGHRSLAATQIYARRRLDLARKFADETG